MTPGDTLTNPTPPLPTPRTPLFRRGSREVEPLSRGGFYNAFHGPPPDGGASRRWDGVVVVLVVSDPVGGAGRTRPLRGRVVTIGIPVQTRSVAGCQLLNQWIRGVKIEIPRNSSKIEVCNQVWLFLSNFFFFTRATSSGDEFRPSCQSRASAALRSLRRVAER